MYHTLMQRRRDVAAIRQPALRREHNGTIIRHNQWPVVNFFRIHAARGFGDRLEFY